MRSRKRFRYRARRSVLSDPLPFLCRVRTQQFHHGNTHKQKGIFIMAVEKNLVILYSSGVVVSAGESSYAAVLEAGSNNSITATSGGVVAETSMGAGTLVVAESGAIVSGININDEGAVFSGTDVICSGAEKWYGPAACATFGSVVLVGGEFTNNSAFASGGYLGQGGAVEGYDGYINISGGIYEANSATGGGGAILAIGGETEIKDATFTANSATYGGAFEVSKDGASATVAGGEFNGNSAGYGGAIEIHQGASALITGAVFTGNQAASGGAVMVDAYAAEKSYLTVVGATFMKNVAEQGGAILNDGVLTVSGGEFIANTADDGKGGALYNTGSATVTGAEFAANMAIYGGAVWQGNRKLELNGNTFAGNSAIYGGALYANGSGATVISGGAFTGNQALYDEDYDLGGMGGAIYVTDAATVTVTGATFSGNVAEVNPDNEWDGGCGGAIINYGNLTIMGGEFSANSAYYGAGLYNQAGAGVPMTVAGANFANNSATYGGAAICNCWGELVVSGGEFSGNKVEKSDGGAIANWSVATVAGATFTGNTAKQGGAISDSWAQSITITNCEFSGNAAEQGGAFIQMNGGTAALANYTFTGNCADQGGAIWNDGALTVTGGEFSDNLAEDGEGGALYNTGSAAVSGATFTGNTAMKGGAICQAGSGAALELDGATVENNVAIYGGAMYLAGSGATVISGGEFTGNGAMYDDDYDLGGMGGAIYVTNAATVTVADVTFTGNVAEVNPDNEWDGGCGGAIINYGKLTVTGGEFDGNCAYYGAGLYNQAGAGVPMTVSGANFANNSATYGGAAICNCWGELVVSGGTYTSNTVEKSDGGAIANWSVATVTGATFTGNSAKQGGAISDSWAQSITITDATFSNNTAEQGGAFIQMNGGTAAFANCTFTGNSATQQGGAIWNDGALTIDGCSFTTATDTIYNKGTITVTGATSFAAEVTNDTTGVFTVALADAADPAVVNGWSFITGGNTRIAVGSGADEGVYTVATGVGTWSGEIGLVDGGTDSGLAFTVENGAVTSGAINYKGMEYTLAVADGTMMLAMESKLYGLTGDQNGVSWTAVPDVDGYAVELSQDDFSTSVAFNVAGNGIDFLTLDAGTYSWRVGVAGTGRWENGNDITAPARTDGPKVVAATADGVSDVFFANATGTWARSYLARNVGSTDGWQGTGEFADLAGKNRFEDIFKGADDANVMYLTDADNGDAIFLDDIYSYGGTTQARMEKISEIRAGAGDDVIDLTSQRYAWNGGQIALRGGSGDDTLWGNAGGAKLFGDAGNDKLVGGSGDDLIAGGSGNDMMRGCGGDDIFVFGGNWGADTVVQEASGNVTLWFDAGDLSKWNVETLTYTDGGNSVTVSGVTADKVELKFGDDDSRMYADMVSLGAFMEQSTAGVFDLDDPSKRVLASL